MGAEIQWEGVLDESLRLFLLDYKKSVENILL